MLMTIIAIPLALFGVYLIGTFLVLRFSDEKHELEVNGFQRKAYLGHRLPVVRYEDPEGNVRLVDIKRIDQLLYLLNPPIEKQIVSVVNVTGDCPSIFGYLRLISGLALILPLFAVLGQGAGKGLFVGQVFYVLVFIGVIVGGWVALKFIQRL